MATPIRKPYLFIRCDESLIRAVKDAAQSDERSVNQFVVRTLHRALAEADAGQAAEAA